MFNPDEIGQLLSDQMQSFMGRKLAHIEPELDDEGTDDRLLLNRWQDLRSPARLKDHSGGF